MKKYSVEEKYRGYGEARQGCRAYTERLTGKEYIGERVIAGESRQDEGKIVMGAW